MFLNRTIDDGYDKLLDDMFIKKWIQQFIYQFIQKFIKSTLDRSLKRLLTVHPSSGDMIDIAAGPLGHIHQFVSVSYIPNISQIYTLVVVHESVPYKKWSYLIV